MRRKLLLVAALPAALLMAPGETRAQVVSDTITVSARNLGVFTFNIADTTFDFGDVDANGTTSSTGVTGARNGANDGAVYTATGATTWTASSAPARTVRVFNASTASTITWGVADRLSLQIPAAGLPAGSVSCGLLPFSTAGDGGIGACAGGNLVHTVDVRNGGNSVAGTLDLQLSVLDVDVAGTNTWTVVLTAAGS
ncbi:MAG: hypothetical protein ACE5IK_01985 [Acidobacteriota bacterium]